VAPIRCLFLIAFLGIFVIRRAGRFVSGRIRMGGR
jgi:hypothetical protein